MNDGWDWAKRACFNEVTPLFNPTRTTHTAVLSPLTPSAPSPRSSPAPLLFGGRLRLLLGRQCDSCHGNCSLLKLGGVGWGAKGVGSALGQETGEEEEERWQVQGCRYLHESCHSRTKDEDDRSVEIWHVFENFTIQEKWKWKAR